MSRPKIYILNISRMCMKIKVDSPNLSDLLYTAKGPTETYNGLHEVYKRYSVRY
jgi:hypothetical protein